MREFVNSIAVNILVNKILKIYKIIWNQIFNLYNPLSRKDFLQNGLDPLKNN